MKKVMISGLITLLAIGVLACTAGSSSSTLSTGTVPTTQPSSAGQAASTVQTNTGGSLAAPNGTGSDEDSVGDMTYTSATKSVSIKQTTTGSGDDTVTYYVADIQLAEGTDLQSALSDGQHGGRAQDTSDIALANNAIVAVNGDYYGAREDGIIIRNGEIYRDIPARTGLALYKDGTMQIYEEAGTSAEQLLADGVWNTYSFGPALLEDGVMGDDLNTYEAEVNPKHGIQGTNPRTGIGIIDTNHFVLVVVDGRSIGHSRGVTLDEFARIFEDLGCTNAYNLDGGGSSTMYFMGEVVNQPSQRSGERSVSDILFIS